MIGTMIAMVWGYLPFVSLAADATYPEEHDFLISEKGLVLNVKQSLKRFTRKCRWLQKDQEK